MLVLALSELEVATMTRRRSSVVRPEWKHSTWRKVMDLVKLLVLATVVSGLLILGAFALYM